MQQWWSRGRLAWGSIFQALVKRVYNLPFSIYAGTPIPPRYCYLLGGYPMCNILLRGTYGDLDHQLGVVWCFSPARCYSAKNDGDVGMVSPSELQYSFSGGVSIQPESHRIPRSWEPVVFSTWASDGALPVRPRNGAPSPRPR